MELGLQDRVALVFGAGGGLGGAIARTLAAEGAKVAVADIAVEAAEATAATLRELGETVYTIGNITARTEGAPVQVK